jgi:hypothetical protein
LSQDETVINGKGSQAFLTDDAGTTDVITRPDVLFHNNNPIAKAA